MPVSKNILGMNARNFLYIRKYNTGSAKRLADDKLETKQELLSHGIKTPGLLAVFTNREEVRSFDWSSLPENGFVIKPARGYGGDGILPIRTFKDGIGKSIVGTEYTTEQLSSHILDILDGSYSLKYLPDKAFIEERVIADPFFKKMNAVGMPDIRIIVFNRIPVMAMLRLSTEESGGKANLHQGAIAFGIDMRTGITTHAISKKNLIRIIPGTKQKVSGIKIPEWDNLLLLATQTQAVIGLGYAGVDIVLDKYKGPLVLEINTRPGLSIQAANLASLRTRLERVERMEVPTPARGVELAKSLFAESKLEKVNVGSNVLTVIQPVLLRGKNKTKQIQAKLDTGAFRSSIDRNIMQDLGLEHGSNHVEVKSASGRGIRPTAHLTFDLAGRTIKTIVSIADRKHLKYPMIIGRNDLGGFVVKPILSEEKKIPDGDVIIPPHLLTPTQTKQKPIK